MAPRLSSMTDTACSVMRTGVADLAAQSHLVGAARCLLPHVQVPCVRRGGRGRARLGWLGERVQLRRRFGFGTAIGEAPERAHGPRVLPGRGSELLVEPLG